MQEFDFTGLIVNGENAGKHGFVVSGPQVDVDQNDAAFYCDGDGSALISVVTLGDRFVEIRCDGQMRVDDVIDECVYRNASALVEAGYRTDEGLEDAESIGAIYFENNPWFDIYGEDGECLSLITHTYTDALEAAFGALLDTTEA